MTAPTPRSWVQPLPEWSPTELPGYAEAKAKAERGESLFPSRVTGAPRPRRTVESLQAELDKLVVKRDGLGVTRNDRAAAMLTRQVALREAARMDRELAKHVRLSKRIDVLEGKIRRAQS